MVGVVPHHFFSKFNINKLGYVKKFCIFVEQLSNTKNTHTMTIKLISQAEYNTLLSIYTNFKALFLQNKGYEYINKHALTDEEKTKLIEVESILKESIHGFSSFSNFRLDKSGNIELRIQYRYDSTFTGVGYILLSELLNGFGK